MDPRAVLYIYLSMVLPLALCAERGRRAYPSPYDIDADVYLSDNSLTLYKTGLLATYSNYSFNGDSSYTTIEGPLYQADESFGCVHISAQNSTVSTYEPVPSRPFIALIPLTNCEHYWQASYAQSRGAAAVIFYSDSSRRLLSNYQNSLDIIVVSITFSDGEMISFPHVFHTNVTATIDLQYTTYTTAHSRAFFFVVFAFSVLILLSIMWFLVSYIRRCCVVLRRRERQIREESMTLRTHKNAIKNLPTRKYDPLKETASSTSNDDPVCAVCLETFVKNEIIRELPCSHEFHQGCVDPWLEEKGTCPLCKYNIVCTETGPTVTISTVSPLIAATNASANDTANDSTNDSTNSDDDITANDTEEEALSLDSLAHVDAGSSANNDSAMIPLNNI